MLCCVWPSLVDVPWLTWGNKYKYSQPAGLEAVEWGEKLTAKSVDASPSCYLLGAEGPDRIRETDWIIWMTKSLRHERLGRNTILVVFPAGLSIGGVWSFVETPG